MFQYACGKALAKKWQTELLFDISYFEGKVSTPNYIHRGYALDIFKINPHIPHELRKQLSLSINDYKTYVEDISIFDGSFFVNGPNQYIEGTFQDFRYFRAASKEVEAAFRFPQCQSPASKKLKMVLEKQENSVSVHIRRGDFLIPRISKVLPVCSEEYYGKAVEHVRSRVPNPFFFVFSPNDREWAEDLFASLNVQYVIVGEEDAGPFAHEDMYMMSLCKHNIIANSSFSWWGAWLNSNPNKVVIAPDKWFVREDLKFKNLALASWTKL